MGLIFITIGSMITAIGITIVIFEKLGLKGLPGDFLIQKGNVTFFFPIVTSIVVSIILTILLSLFHK